MLPSALPRAPGSGRGLLRGHVFAYGPTAAVLRMRSLACGPTAAWLRAVALTNAPSAAAARLPSAARSATALRPSASGTALGPHAPAVCLRLRAQPRPLRHPRPVAAPAYAALRAAPLLHGSCTPFYLVPIANAPMARREAPYGVTELALSCLRLRRAILPCSIWRGNIMADARVDVLPDPAAGYPSEARETDSDRSPNVSPRRGTPVLEKRAPYLLASPYHLERYSSLVMSPAATSSMSWRFSEAVS